MEKLRAPAGVKIISVLFIIIYWWTMMGIIAGIFLWKGKNWARLVVCIICGIGAIIGFLMIAGGGGVDVYDIVTIIVNLTIIGYLFTNRKANYYFGQV